MRLTFLGFIIVSVVSAADLTGQIIYSVVSLEGGQQDMSVIVDNKSYPLTPSAEIPILYTGSAPVATQGYSYALTTGKNSIKVEPFTRNTTNTSTPNETFGRSWNTKNVAKLDPILPPIQALNRLETSLHVEGEIPTIYISGNQTAFDYMHNNTLQEITIPVDISYISPNDIKIFPGVELELAGRSSRWFPKVSYKIELKDEKDSWLYNYQRLKLRALANDDSYLREKLAYDLINAVGLASTKFSHVRVVMNDKPLGLFGLIETFKNPWLRNEFANGDENYENGPLYQGAFLSSDSIAEKVYSDLSYYENNITKYELGQYKIKENATNGDSNFQLLMDFTKFISEAPTNTSDAVEVWQKTFDTDSFLRSMALEVLVGYSDGYISMADNYYIYFEPKSSRYIYIPSDLDMTFGSGFMNLSQVTSGNYSTFPGFYTRPLLNKILQVPEFESQFTDLIFEITAKLFNPEKLEKRIDDQVEMIAEDVAWDKQSHRVSKNIFVDGATIENLKDTLPSNVDVDTANDFATRIGHPVPLEAAIEGPTGHLSMPGLKEYIRIQSENTLKFYESKK